MNEENKDSIALEGVAEMGYGNIYKMPMKDRRLSIEAKAIYAYMCSYGGGGSNAAFPSVELLCKDLNISEKRLRRYREELVVFGYIEIEKIKVEGKNYTRNRYLIKMEVNKEGFYERSEYSEPKQRTDNFIPSQNDTLPKRQGSETTGSQFDSNIINSSLNNNSNTNNNSKRLLAATEIVNHYKTLNNLPKILTFTDKRRGNVNARIDECSLEIVKDTLTRMNNTKFFINSKKEKWLTFDWIFNPNNFVKIIEGKYWDRENGGNQNEINGRNTKANTGQAPSFNLPRNSDEHKERSQMRNM